MLLNPDATISADGVLALQKELHASARLACVAPAQINPVTGATERVVWPFPSPTAAWLTAIGAGRTDRRHGFVIGSILLMRRSALDDVGELDERFFLYAEETDWQRRALDQGWTIGFVPEVAATHIGAGTGGSARAPVPAVPHVTADVYGEALRQAGLEVIPARHDLRRDSFARSWQQAKLGRRASPCSALSQTSQAGA